MTLPEFITYCRLADIISREGSLDDVHKLIITVGLVHAELMYNCKTMKVVKCHLFINYVAVGNPNLHKIIKAVLPDEIQ